METKIVEETVNCFIKSSFLFIFGYVYCIKSPKILSLPLSFGREQDENENEVKINFANLEKSNFTELKDKVESNLTAIEKVEKRFKNLEGFIKTGDLTKYQKALDAE